MTCTQIVSALGAPIEYCGQPERHRVFVDSVLNRGEVGHEYACGEAHLAELVRSIALYEVCDFRVERYSRRESLT